MSLREEKKNSPHGFQFFGLANERKIEKVKRQSLNRVKERATLP